MKACAKILIAGLAVTAAVPAWSQLRAVSDATIGSGAKACLGLTGDAAANRALLRERGWKAGEIKSGDGKTIAAPIEPWGRDGLVLMLVTETGKAGCMIAAGVPNKLDANRLIETVAAAVGQKASVVTKEGAMWMLSQGQSLMLMLGRNDKQALVRMIVTPSGATQGQ